VFQYENIEAIALSYIYVSILIIFLYDSKKNYTSNNAFMFDEWLTVMQSTLENIAENIFGK
jgi:hypothetical protein